MCKQPTSHYFSWRSAGRKTLITSLLAGFALVFSACKKESVEVAPSITAAQNPTMQQLLSMGFAAQHIEDKGDYYLVEGDIRFNKQTPAPTTPVGPGVIAKSQDQASTYALIDPSRQNIKIGIDPSFPSQWQSDVQLAASDWNNIGGNTLSFVVVAPSNADIVFSVANLQNGALGQAEFPTNGAPGYRVRIDPSVPDNLRHLVFTHELGHCFGFRHTNLYVNGEGAGAVGGVIIPETPREDPNSVMNSGDSPNQARGWVGFSNYDKIAFQNLYPEFITPYITNGFYFRLVAENSGQALTVEGNSTAAGARIIQYPQGSSNDQWSFVDVGGGYYKIISRNSGQALTVEGNSTAAGARIIQYPYQGSGNDQWSLQDVGGGDYKIKARSSGQVLNVYGNSTDVAAPIIQYPYVAAGNDQWYVKLLPN